MNKNVGKTDKVVRIILGLAIGAAGIYFKQWWGLIGAVLLLTALINWCPLYVPFKLNTFKKS
ncbi:MAG: DUF2892 domain-containing protein [Bacteroidales bacterium]|nr:DUF2892 domain-containing protein [Bacteroidales bacterium]MBN2821499.1 DUF2892 domain-containing protein [Bacteroidales bacterium]